LLGRRSRGCLAESRVVWTSSVNPDAAHDILSVDDDGEVLWIEVRATTGTDGRFARSVGEFARAARERSHHIIWRVYLAGGRAPRARPFRDPVGMLTEGNLRLDIATLAAQVAPLDSPQSPWWEPVLTCPSILTGHGAPQSRCHRGLGADASA
jgi:hypothetical protein